MEKEMTNRQWLQSLSDTQLAQWMRGELTVKFKGADCAVIFNTGDRVWGTVDAAEQWLRSPQEYEVVGYF